MIVELRVGELQLPGFVVLLDGHSESPLFDWKRRVQETQCLSYGAIAVHAEYVSPRIVSTVRCISGGLGL